MYLEGNHQRAWKKDEARTSKLVFIGRHLDPDALRIGFEDCRAGRSE
jgi:G3E family GTPase